ncbi:hypothetical protein H7Y63_01710 [Polaromonas sp.]|nr:hypothetical protein [Candidatus Saccharibacteria bacterium]
MCSSELANSTLTAGGTVFYDRPPQESSARVLGYTHYGGQIMIQEPLPLTDRRLSCTVLVGLGLRYEDISERLDISRSTIKSTLVRSYSGPAFLGSGAVNRYFLENGYAYVTWPAQPLLMTTRETTVLDTISGGGSLHEAARDLRIDINTVKSHLSNIKEKNNMARNAALITRALMADQLRLHTIV